MGTERFSASPSSMRLREARNAVRSWLASFCIFKDPHLSVCEFSTFCFLVSSLSYRPGNDGSTWSQLDAIRYYQPPFSVAKPNRNRSLARKSGFPNTQSKDDASRTSKSCTNDSVRVDGYDVIECLDLTESPSSITLQGQAGALVRAKPAVGKSHPKT